MGKRILIVDDDMTALDLVDLLFEEKGWEVIRRANGASAVEAVREVQPDVILLDLMMPEMSGQEAIAAIRREGIDIPIVAFTALDDSEVHEEVLKAGCNKVLTKPCRPKELVRIVTEIAA